jgi:hypothetical protein
MLDQGKSKVPQNYKNTAKSNRSFGHEGSSGGIKLAHLDGKRLALLNGLAKLTRPARGIFKRRAVQGFLENFGFVRKGKTFRSTREK